VKGLCARVVGEDDVERLRERNDVEAKRSDERIWCDGYFCSAVELC